MKNKITKDEVIALAKLVKLDLSQSEVDHYTTEISELLTYFEQLDNLDLDDVVPTISVGNTSMVARKDIVVNQLATPDELKEILPRRKDDYIQNERMI